MSPHTQRHIALGPPLVPGYPNPGCQTTVIIPARNEEAILPRTLDALRRQVDLRGQPLDPASFEVILLLNNCTDRSEEVAECYRSAHPEFPLHVAARTFSRHKAHVGTARRMLMDTAYSRLQRSTYLPAAILSTDADTVVAPDWIARNLQALAEGADVVGGVIHLMPEDLDALRLHDHGTFLFYQRDREFHRLAAHLESFLDPDPADPWPRHLEHFGASLACTPAIYALSGGLPPIQHLEDVAFIDALRKVGARIRHCPQVHIFTSARLRGRAQVGLSGQLREWHQMSLNGDEHILDSAEWVEHRFRSVAALRRLNESLVLPDLSAYPAEWHERLALLHADRLTTPRFLELLDCNALIEELFRPLDLPHHTGATESLRALAGAIERQGVPALATR